MEVERCHCKAILPENPYKIGNSKVCEACYARWVRDGIEPEVERHERQSRKERGNAVRCKSCGGLFKAQRVDKQGLCWNCDERHDDGSDGDDE